MSDDLERKLAWLTKPVEDLPVGMVVAIVQRVPRVWLEDDHVWTPEGVLVETPSGQEVLVPEGSYKLM